MSAPRKEKPRASDAVLAARALIERLEIRAPEEIDVEAIAAHLGAFVIPKKLVGQEGNLVRGGATALIAVDEPAYGTPRGRFVVAHEIGHFLLHVGTDVVSACTRADLMGRGRQYKAETEASEFAAELLMPEPLFAPMCDERTITLEEVSILAGRFETSLTATALRVVEYSEAPCAVACSQKGVVSWWAATPSFRPRLKRRFRIGPETPAGCEEHMARHEAHDRPERVPAEAWTNEKKTQNVELYEHSVPLSPQGSILSLLWHAPD